MTLPLWGLCVAIATLLLVDFIAALQTSDLGARWRAWRERMRISEVWHQAHAENEAHDRAVERVRQLRRCDVCEGRETNGDFCLYSIQCGYDEAQRALARWCRGDYSYSDAREIERLHENYVQTRRLRTNARLEQERRSAA